MNRRNFLASSGLVTLFGIGLFAPKKDAPEFKQDLSTGQDSSSFTVSDPDGNIILSGPLTITGVGLDINMSGGVQASPAFHIHSLPKLFNQKENP